MNKELRTFGRYVSANVLGMIGLSCYILADTYFIAKGLGGDGLAALNLAIVMYSVISAVGQMIGIGGGTRYGVARAREDQREMNHAFTQAFYMIVAAAILFEVCGIFLSEPLTYLLGANEDTFAMTHIYLKVMLLFSPAFLCNQLMLGFVRNDGKPALCMVAMLAGSGLNIILDYVFIFVTKWGMFGAVFATCLAPITSLCVLFSHKIKGNNHFHLHRCKLQIKQIGMTAGLGLSAFINETSSAIILFLFNLVILSLEGNIGVAAYGVVANLALVAVAMFNGIANGVQPIISEAYGKADFAKTKLQYRYAVRTALCVATILYAAIFLFTTPIVAAFNGENNATLQSLAEIGLQLYFIGFFFAGFNIITASYFGATEKIRQSFLLSILRGLVLIIVMLVLLSKICGMIGVWLTFPCTEVLALGIAVYLMRRIMQKER